MTKKEKQQLRKDIKYGKVNIDDLYEKYQINMPLMLSYKEYQQVYGKATIEEYEKDDLDTKINFLFMQI